VKTESRLLITRFSPKAELLALELNKVGCFSIAQPLLRIEALEDALTTEKFVNGYYDVVIAVSGNAVECTKRLINKEWPKATYIAVGVSTQALLNDVIENEALVPEDSADSEGLLNLELLQSIQGKRILILRGQGGRDLLDKTLAARGAEVTFLESYKRVKLDLNGIELVNNWQQASINGAIISSTEILNQLFTLVPNKYKDWLSKLILYVPSGRVAEQASLLGARQVVILPSLRTERIVEFFKENNGKCK